MMRYCNYNGCNRRIDRGLYCDEHKPKRKHQSKNKPFYRSPEWQRMREYIYERDGGCCKECGRFVFGRQAHIHHIVPISENPSLKLDPNNLILLCESCHKKVEEGSRKWEERLYFQS